MSILEKRLEAGITQAELARAVSCSRQTVNRLERGLEKPRPLLRHKLAIYFACDPDDIYTYADEIERLQKEAQSKPEIKELRQERQHDDICAYDNELFGRDNWQLLGGKSKTLGFKTIRQTAALGIINENYLRKMREDGQLPGFRIGSRFMVDVDRLIDQLREWSTRGGKQT